MPGAMAELGMTRGARSELAKAPQLLQVHSRIAGQVEQRVQQHRAVAGGQHEAIAVGPLGRARIEAQKAREQDGRDVRHAHGHAGMTGLGGFDRIHRQRADRVGQILVAGLVRGAALEAWKRRS